MKYNYLKFPLFICILFIFSFLGCKKDGHLSGGSLHEAITPLNNMDYLKANALNLFDTTTFIIERFDLTDVVNNAKTFFAFTDYSVANMIALKLQQRQATDPLAVYTLDSLLREINGDSIKQYILNDMVDLDNAPELQARPFLSSGNTNMAVIKQLQTNSPYVDRTRAATFLLFYIKVRGELDQPGVIPPPNENDIIVQCQTSGIKTSNGATTLHVLNNNHTFVRF